MNFTTKITNDGAPCIRFSTKTADETARMFLCLRREQTERCQHKKTGREAG